MPDREKVIKGLECCIKKPEKCRKCPYDDYGFCFNIITKDALELLKAEEPRVLTLDEVMSTSGAGWVEIWYQADGEEPESKLLIECAWCRGNLILDDRSNLTKGALKLMYNKQYGERIWAGDREPTDEEREAAKWGE